MDRLISESDARVKAQVLQSKLKQVRDAEKLKTSTKGKGRLGGLKGSGRVAEVAWACRGCLWGLTHLSAAGLSIIGRLFLLFFFLLGISVYILSLIYHRTI